MAMEVGRLQDLSMIYWLKDLVASTFIQVVDGFPSTKLIIPSISIEWNELDAIDYELGNREGLMEREYYIDVYAQSKSQRDELIYMIHSALKNPILIYDYNEGFPPSVTPSQIGCLLPIRRTARNIPVLAELVPEMYYRATVNYMAAYQNNR